MSKSQLRASQILTTFGPGSLMDLPDTSAIVGGLDHWLYSGNQRPTIDEARLVAKIRARLENPQLTLRKPPAEENDLPGELSGITTWEFPQWYLVQDPIKTIDGTQRRLVHRHRLTGGKFKDAGKNYNVVPIRFVRACENGHVDDVDWLGYAHHYARQCAGQLFLEEIGTTGEIANIRVRCSCGDFRPLSQAVQKGTKSLGMCTGNRPWLGAFASEPCECWSRLLTRSASNAYFPQLLSVISIPDQRSTVDELVASLWENHFIAVSSPEEMAYELRKPPVRAILGAYSPEQIWPSIERIRTGIATSVEIPVKEAEFDVLNEAKAEIGSNVPDGDFYARLLPSERWNGTHLNLPDRLMEKVEKVVLVHRLREVIALLGFTRFESLGADVNGELPDELNLKVKPARLSLDADWLPAVESRGEGIFIVLKTAEVERWAVRPEVLQRGATLSNGFRLWQESHANKTRKFPGIQYYMLHTLAHSLMTAITLDCGYPASSIRERIYCLIGTSGKPSHYGVLLHTSSNDAEGTLGGLVEAGRRIRYFFRRALELALLCSNDPVCSHHQPVHHDPSPLLGAACHGCMLIPETSCEQRNDFLDRSLLVPTVERTGIEFFEHV
jgi:Domain of unknown function (DUF1998)